ncbi:MAG: 1-aminocyclopropane-1-carboxylate deaminase/D-cysteine desulfhydrase [Gammaproteobacteria bacterium]
MHPHLIALEQRFNPSILTRIDDPLLDRRRIELSMKRDDLLHPVISGNKWRKLKYCLDHALSMGSETVISMGGAYSNHLHALAYAGHALGLNTIGLVRGERPNPLTPTLQDCLRWSMELRFVSRSEYRLLRHHRAFDSLPGIESGQYWLPEGGAHALALKGVAELIAEIDRPYDLLCLPCGTGTTLAGCAAAVPAPVHVTGFAALKHADFLTSEVELLLSRPYNNWSINPDYHFGGFARTTKDLLRFIGDFEFNAKIPLEPVYTGKLMYALYDLIAQGRFSPGTRIIAVHTGGLQGNRSRAATAQGSAAER